MNTAYNPFSLSGKTILITGASSGIGRATAIECSQMGARIIITGRDQQRLNETFVQLTGIGHRNFAADLNLEVQLNELVDDLPKLDGIVHSAGIVKTLPFQFINRDDLTTTFDINFIAPVLLSQKLIKAKKFNKESSIVFISSINGPLIASMGHSVYAASKGAICSMVKNMALELSSKKIRVNAVLPGMTETPLIHREDITSEQLEIDKKHYPFKRYAKPEEVAYSAIYFLSDASAWVTGTNIVVDGGFTLT
jgi:NAD(P)-dependent dehydrogenase (short-subunit alcohol dehydrogenase family)